MILVERVARALCVAAGSPQAKEYNGICIHCEQEPSFRPEARCLLWKTFEGEARQAIAAVRAGDRGR